ncbi:MAG TPA: hypothetical protein PLL06_15020 [Acidobacteriota bacterium]|nr:hypothetical protein [Acidobacteriota bacterium]HMZ81012.1 hypothetical protein [Acidobacteriota bacterium]HNB74056.1 hypothetical protein [Acidobacteriota bacterium]HND21209.1 hypothetical protein [Acidobacteriota bacterium]HNG95363.1 hypothetical protein [Acidobacteriota bacterium]
MGSTDAPQLNIGQHWLCPEPTTTATFTHYRPAVFLECQLRFHHLRAHIKHTAEKRYTAWYPRGQASVDWDIPALGDTEVLNIAMGPPHHLPHKTENFDFSDQNFREFIEEKLNKLVRTARLKVFHNAHFDVFSEPDETRDHFITRLAEKAPDSIENDLNNLIRRVNMKISQVRETQERRGRKLEIPEMFINDILMERRHELFASQYRLEALFSSGEKLLVTSSDGIASFPINDPEYIEMMETLQLIEDETKRELNELCTRCIQKVSECDLFEIGLQRNQIHILRKGVLWVPTA